MTKTSNRPVVAVLDGALRRNGQTPAMKAPPGSPSELADRAQRLADELTTLRRDLLSLVASVEVPTVALTAPTLLSAPAAAEYLMISRTMIFALIKSGELTSVLIGSARRVPRSACDDYVAGLLAARKTA